MKFGYVLLCGCLICGALYAKTDNFRNDFFDENKVKLKDINYTAETAGMSKRFDRSFENSPPLIPHDLEGMIPITADLNACTNCHLPEFAVDLNSTSVPKTHLVDLRTGKDDNGELETARYDCLACHVPQANAKPLVKNNFKAEFRSKNEKHSSNLIDKLNEGVK